MSRPSWFGLAAVSVAMAIHAAVRAEPVDAAKSGVTATFKQMGVSVEARFTRVAGQVMYDAAQVGASKASMTIDIASIDLGDPQYNAEVLKKTWFDAAHFPTATFTSTTITPRGPDRFDAAGALTIKGHTVTVVVPVVVKTEGGMRRFEGALPIRRLAFDIGEGEWHDTSLVDDDVVIKFKLAVGAKK